MPKDSGLEQRAGSCGNRATSTAPSPPTSTCACTKTATSDSSDTRVWPCFVLVWAMPFTFESGACTVKPASAAAALIPWKRQVSPAAGHKKPTGASSMPTSAEHAACTKAPTVFTVGPVTPRPAAATTNARLPAARHTKQPRPCLRVRGHSDAGARTLDCARVVGAPCVFVFPWGCGVRRESGKSNFTKSKEQLQNENKRMESVRLPGAH